MNKKILLDPSDITEMAVDAIVCPALSHLMRGRGLSADIFDKAGDGIVAACNALEDCAVGEARITPGFSLPAKHIIHTVTPQWVDGDQWGASDLHLLRGCYDAVLSLAEEKGLKSIAIPTLGAGADKSLHLLVARVGAEAIKVKADAFDEIVINVQSEQARACWEEALGLTEAA